MENQIIPVLLAGGIGSRLWPVSRESYPKQFCKLFDDLSLLQKRRKEPDMFLVFRI
nr:sugar phosphate nucleotidyltransferase [Coxiella-like endosymbiont of Rhipicephalus sanguineus]